MINFKHFKDAVSDQFNRMNSLNKQLYRVEIDKDKLWETYLSSFPEGTNPIFRERTEHDCSACRHFVKSVGNVVSIVNGQMVTIWDCAVDGFYQEVADAMANFVKLHDIENIFLHHEPVAGLDSNIQMTEAGSTITWNHFFVRIPDRLFVRGDSKGAKLAEAKASHDVLLRSLHEITPDAIETVLDLIGQKSLYRGEEHLHSVAKFKELKLKFDKLSLEYDKDLFIWHAVGYVSPSVTRIRSTVIGTLLLEISGGIDLEAAVSSFEAKVAPMNYKRPSALITKTMIKKAQEKVEALGLLPSLSRRYAVEADVAINNVLFASRAAKLKMNAFDELSEQAPVSMKKLDRVESVPIHRFINEVLPKLDSVEVLFENRHAPNLVSLIAPVEPDSKHIFKWNNNFSWCYSGELADSIKEKVKAAGGNVSGYLRCSLSWFNFDDLDLHMQEPDGFHIYFSRKNSLVTGGQLDVDMNANYGKTRSPVENICYPIRSKMEEGRYHLNVHNYCKRESADVGFEVEMEFDGTVMTFSYPNAVRDGQTINVAVFDFTKKGGIKIVKSIESNQATKEIWGINTQQFHPVKMIMNSPNYWDGQFTGNRHFFFMLDGCTNPDSARGFFNEFLTDDLMEHRKVFEVLGSKMKTEMSSDQISGLGFSSTKKNNVICRVKGSFNRTIKVEF